MWNIKRVIFLHKILTQIIPPFDLLSGHDKVQVKSCIWSSNYSSMPWRLDPFFLNQAYTESRKIIFNINISTSSPGCLWTLIKAHLLILIVLHAEILKKQSKNVPLKANMTTLCILTSVLGAFSISLQNAFAHSVQRILFWNMNMYTMISLKNVFHLYYFECFNLFLC